MLRVWGAFWVGVFWVGGWVGGPLVLVGVEILLTPHVRVLCTRRADLVTGTSCDHWSFLPLVVLRSLGYSWLLLLCW